MTYTQIPSTVRIYRIRREVLIETRTFLAERGSEGFEAVVLWLGTIVDEETAEIVAVYAPEQIARASKRGVSVEVTQDGLARLISSLTEGLFVLARVHSHPGGAYHSDLDDQNMLISHQGAISVVVPGFASDPIDLMTCSVNELKHGGGWRELPSAEVAERFFPYA